jgi:hypothetical protein
MLLAFAGGVGLWEIGFSALICWVAFLTKVNDRRIEHFLAWHFVTISQCRCSWWCFYFYTRYGSYWAANAPSPSSVGAMSSLVSASALPSNRHPVEPSTPMRQDPHPERSKISPLEAHAGPKDPFSLHGLKRPNWGHACLVKNVYRSPCPKLL